MVSPNKTFSRTIWILSLVSFFTDFASEMLYPVMPVYLESIGYSVLFIGILEGLAETVAGLGKGYFGGLSDQMGKRLVFVRLGYTLSALSKPMMALLTTRWWILFARTTDRLGKGLRTGARDAMLSTEAPDSQKGAVFGFHRSFDTLGAVAGPVLALVFLSFYPGQYAYLFLFAFIPGILAIWLTLLLKEKKIVAKSGQRISFLNTLLYWKKSSAGYRQLTGALLVFALFNSTDLLLLLRVKEAGYADQLVIGSYIFYNLVYALLAFPMGHIGDRIGLWKILLVGLGFYFITYLGFGFQSSFWGFLVFFGLYGLYAAATEGIAKALIAKQVPVNQTASAIGCFAGLQSMASFFASSFAGLLWFRFGAATAFLTTACIALLVLFYLGICTSRWRGPKI